MPGVEATLESTHEKLREKLRDLVPDIELRCKSALVHEINRKKRERGAVILGHNYMEPALYYGVADIVGDSLELCRRAVKLKEQTIVFCGVRFMAETAKILNPDKTALLPAMDAGCSLAASISAADIRALKSRFPGVPVVTYINTYAEVKAESDTCCTSSNAATVVQSFGDAPVIFLPDAYLARNVARDTGRRVINADEDSRAAFEPAKGDIIAWTGKCEVHEQFTVEDISAVRQQVLDVIVLAHPECSPEVIQAADYSGSTSAMSRFVRDSEAQRFLLMTECAMGDNVAAENPTKEMVRLCSVRCPHMNEITLEQTLAALERQQHVIDVPERIRNRARRALDRMLSVC